MADTSSKIIKDSLSELKYGMIATAIVLSLSVVIYIFIPTIRTYFSEKDSSITHSRLYQITPSGGEITYILPQVLTGNKTESELVTDLKTDLENLSRRFTRGKFDLLSLAGSRDAEQVQNMAQQKDNFTYTVTSDQKSAKLTITAANPAAKKALENYMNYMKERWEPGN